MAGAGSLFAAQSAAARSEPAARPTYMATQISAGEIRSRLDTSDPILCEILAGLHRKSPPALIAEQLGAPSAVIAQRLDALIAEGLVHRDARGRLRPSVPVITRSDAARYMQPSPAHVEVVTDAICEHAAWVKDEFTAIDAVRRADYEDLSLLLYSDVLMDNWQIEAVEKEFLRAPRPLRRGGRYYFSVFENEPDVEEDPFGIYGNHSQRVGNVELRLYGNARYRGRPNLVTLPPADVQARFGFPAATTVAQARAQLVQGLAALARGHRPGLTDRAIEGLKAYGLIDRGGRTLAPMFSPEDDRALYRIAASFRPSFISILSHENGELRSRFSSTPYSGEGVAFNEWFIWYYHFLYTAVTNELAARGVIRMPARHVVTYLSQLY